MFYSRGCVACDLLHLVFWSHNTMMLYLCSTVAVLMQPVCAISSMLCTTYIKQANCRWPIRMPCACSHLAADLLSTAAEVAQRQSLPIKWRFHLCLDLITAYMCQGRWSASCAVPCSFLVPIIALSGDWTMQVALMSRQGHQLIIIRDQCWIGA